MKISFVIPAIGKMPRGRYIRAWQMEPLAIAQLAALTPEDIEVELLDDRLEDIEYDRPTDLVAISVETYTARRAYQIAHHFRRRGKTVVMGGFHATLCPDEVAQHADSVVIGEAEGVWQKVLDDFRAGSLKKRYKKAIRLSDYDIIPRRSIYRGKDYLPITLLEAGRGCKFRCDFCAIHQVFERRHGKRKISTVIRDIRSLKDKKRLLFFVDDNICSNKRYAKELFEALIPLGIRWVGQADITAAYDDELLQLMYKSGCQGVLVGMESLDREVLARMNKSFNAARLTPEQAVRKFHRHGLRLYLTFLFGYGKDSPEQTRRILDFCMRNKIFMAGFNHLTPFPGTTLFQTLQKEQRLLFDKWWLHPDYRYGTIPFQTEVDPHQVEQLSQYARRQFYSLKSILYRMTNPTNIRGAKMFFAYLLINFLLRNDQALRMQFPLGDPNDIDPVHTPVNTTSCMS